MIDAFQRQQVPPTRDNSPAERETQGLRHVCQEKSTVLGWRSWLELQAALAKVLCTKRAARVASFQGGCCVAVLQQSSGTLEEELEASAQRKDSTYLSHRVPGALCKG